MSFISALANLALSLIVLGLYWFPSILGLCKRRPDLATVVVVNALLGWTVVGWVVALGRVLRPVGTRAAGPEPYGTGHPAWTRSSVGRGPQKSRQVELTDLR